MSDPPAEPNPPESLPRMSSGVAGLDAILLGGFVRSGIYIVQGRPGSGKTVFGNQVCFAHAQAGGNALYVTLLSEQHDRMLANIRSMSFFRPELVAHSLNYVSAFQILERDGLEGLLTLIRREMVARQAGVLVIDGLVAAARHAPTEIDLKKFVHELQMLATTGDCTMLLLTSSGDAIISPEHTMVDGLLELGTEHCGWRAERSLIVHKFRGSDYLAGHHAMRITDQGLVAWPRTEALLATQPGRRALRGPRLSTGIDGLDRSLQGGLPAASATLVLGPTGAGKTAVGLHFLAAGPLDEPALMLSFYESPESLLERAETMRPGFVEKHRAGALEILWHSASEDLLDRIAHELVATARDRGVRRLLIDGLTGFEDMTVQPARIPGFYRALSQELRGLGITTMYTVEVPDLVGPIVNAPIRRLTPVAENLLLLRYVEQEARLKRLISVMKVRDSGFDPRLREFEIRPGGIVIGDGFDGARSVLTGFPSPADGDAEHGQPPAHAAGEA